MLDEGAGLREGREGGVGGARGLSSRDEGFQGGNGWVRA